MGFLGKEAIHVVSEVLQQLIDHGMEKGSDSLGKAFKLRVEEKTKKSQSYGLYVGTLNKLSETRTDIPKRLIDSLKAENELERKARKRAKTQVPPTPADPNVDRNIWKSTAELATIFIRSEETVRKNMLAERFERIFDSNSNPARYLYSVNDAKKMYGDPEKGTLKKPHKGFRRKPLSAPVAPVAPITNPKRQPVAKPVSEQASDKDDVLTIYGMFNRGLLTQDQMADALGRLRNSHR